MKKCLILCICILFSSTPTLANQQYLFDPNSYTITDQFNTRLPESGSKYGASVGGAIAGGLVVLGIMNFLKNNYNPYKHRSCTAIYQLIEVKNQEFINHRLNPLIVEALAEAEKCNCHRPLSRLQYADDWNEINQIYSDYSLLITEKAERCSE